MYRAEIFVWGNGPAIWPSIQPRSHMSKRLTKNMCFGVFLL